MPFEIFSIPSSQFTVFRSESGITHWIGSFQGQEVIGALPIDENSQCIILLNWLHDKKPVRQNLLCVQPDGHIIWKIALPDSHDCVVGIQIVSDELLINTWNGYRIRVDLSTGNILNQKFVK